MGDVIWHYGLFYWDSDRSGYYFSGPNSSNYESTLRLSLLNELGQEGWEAVCVTHDIDGDEEILMKLRFDT